MKNLRDYLTDINFKKKVNEIIASYVDEMQYNEGMETNLSDYFTDTLYIARVAFNTENVEESVIDDLKGYIECEVRDAIKRRDLIK